jgi:ankyrin repeat protein
MHLDTSGLYNCATRLLCLSLLYFALSLPGWSDVPVWIRQEQLLQACQRGDTPAVRRALKSGVSARIQDKFEQPAVVRAVRGAHARESVPMIEVLKALREAGADFNAVNQFGTSAIFLTVPNNVHDPAQVFHFLVQHGASEFKKDRYGLLPRQRPDFQSHTTVALNEAIWRLLLEGDLASIRDYQKPQPRSSTDTPTKPSLDLDHSPRTIAMAAAYYGEESKLRDLVLAQAVDLATVDENGENLVFYAATSGQHNCLIWLEGQESLFGQSNHAGETPLIRACQFGHNYFVQKLIRYGVDADHRDKTGRTALHYAAEFGHPIAVLALLSRADSEIELPDGRTALMLAVENRHRQAVKAFVVARLAGQGKEAEQDPQLAKKLTSIQFDHQNRLGQTPLMLAVIAHDKEMVDLILQAKPKLELKDNQGKTALDLARISGINEIYRLLETR